MSLLKSLRIIFIFKSKIYLLGELKNVITLQHYFKNEKNWDLKNLKAKPFWKETKQI